MRQIGKADRTTDELFELFENNFNKQQNCAIRLQKEVKNYATCIRCKYLIIKLKNDKLNELDFKKKLKFIFFKMHQSKKRKGILKKQTFKSI